MEYNERFTWIMVLYALVLVLVAFILPFILLQQPLGDGDTYTHMYLADFMAESTGITDFYSKVSVEYRGYLSEVDYPPGLWLHGAIVSHITGLTAREIGVLLPLLWLLPITSSIFIFAKLFLRDRIKAIIATIFFLTTPLSIEFIGFYTRVFILPFFILSLYVMFNSRISRMTRVILFLMFSTLVVFSHSATTVVLTSILIGYPFMHVLFTKGERRHEYYVYLLSILTSLVLIMWLNPNSYPNLYRILFKAVGLIDKLPIDTNVLTAGYSELIKYKNLVYVIPVGFIYIIFLELIHRLRDFFVQRTSMFSEYHQIFTSKFLRLTPYVILVAFLVACVFTIHDLRISRALYTNSVFALVFWLGPIQSILLLFGLRGLNKDFALLTITVTLIVLPFMPLGDAGASTTTGLTRFIYYLMVVTPLIAAEGFTNLINLVPYRRITAYGVAAVFLALFTSLQVGVLYFLPSISETPSEIAGLSFLKSTSEERITLAPNLRQRLEMYGHQKDAAWIIPSYERTFGVYAADDLNALEILRDYNVSYVIDSKRTRKELGVDRTTLGRSPEVNKIYSANNFNIYELTSVHDIEYRGC